MKKDDQRSMVCPLCNGNMTVTDTQKSKDEPNAIMRRRMCNECGARFVSVEKIVRQIGRKA